MAFLPYCTCALSHTSSPQKGLLVLWISVLERLSNRQKKTLKNPAWPPPLSAMPLNSQHPCLAATLHAGNLSRVTAQPLWPCLGCDRAAAWFKHNLGISAGVFEVACMQRPSHGAAKSGRLLGMGFSMAACETVPVFDVVNRAGRAGWQGGRQARWMGSVALHWSSSSEPGAACFTPSDS